MDLNRKIQIQDSLPDILDTGSTHPSYHWNRDATMRYLTKSGWEQALEDAQRLLIFYRSSCVRLEQTIYDINLVLQAGTLPFVRQ